jgi:RNA polymerase sigma factor (sigma-70 family)
MHPPCSWPIRVATLFAQLRDRSHGVAQGLRAEAWLLLRDALMSFLRGYATRLYRANLEDLEDLASEKALDLLRRGESGEWNPDGRLASEVAGYVAATARNGLLKLARRNGRAVSASPEQIETMSLATSVTPRPAEAPASAAVEVREFMDSLRDCIAKLQPRARRVWFFRVYYEMSSRAIATTPGIELTPEHVDVVMQRARESLRVCMGSAGFESRADAPGVFIELWECLESLRDTPEFAPAGDVHEL